MKFTGILKLREVPDDMPSEDYHRMSLKDREQITVYEAKNILTMAGWSQLLNYIANQSTAPFGKIFCVGTGSISYVTAGDTGVSNELGRVSPGVPTIVGTQVIVPCSFTASQFPGNWTNVGLFGTAAATTTLFTGTLFTHALFSYTKSATQAVVIDYLINLE